MDNKLAHRDDLPMEVVAELEKQIGELYPGLKVVFAGDAPAQDQPDMAKLLEALDKKAARSFSDGSCIDCGAIMPHYNPDDSDWVPAKGWGSFGRVGTNEFMGWQCPKCDYEESDCIPRPINLD